MKYTNTKPAQWIRRISRFSAEVDRGGLTEVVHVKTTGRCQELFVPGANVVLQGADKPERKTKWDVISVEKPECGWINVDSQVCNLVMAEYFERQQIPFRREVKCQSSRFDFLLDDRIYAEVKGCTLEINKTGLFPDAPTIRGTKHVRELAELARQGRECWIIFVIAINSVSQCTAHEERDPAFARALREAFDTGVRVFDARCKVEPDGIEVISLEEKRNVN